MINQKVVWHNEVCIKIVDDFIFKCKKKHLFKNINFLRSYLTLVLARPFWDTL